MEKNKKFAWSVIIIVGLLVAYFYSPLFDRVRISEAFIKSGIKQNSRGYFELSQIPYGIALIINPKSAWGYNALGTSYYNIAKYRSFSRKVAEKNYRIAIDNYNRAIELSYNYVSAYGNRGNCYERLGMYKEALADYLRALSFDKEDYTALYGLTMVYSTPEFNRYPEAVEILTKLIERKPEEENLYFGLGWAYDKMNMPKKSIEAYEKLSKINPNRIDVWINLSYVSELKLKDYSSAIKYADKALELNQYSLYALGNKAYALIQLKRYDEASIYVDRAFNIDSHYPRGHFQRGQIRLAKGDKSGAKEDLKIALEAEQKYPSDDSEIIIGMINNFLKQCEK